MQYRGFPKIQNKLLSVLGLGMMRLPLCTKDTEFGKAGEAANIDSDATKKLIEAAYNAGVNYFDTAYIYHHGKSEGVLGRSIRDLNIRDTIYIADKMPMWLVKEEADLERIFSEQLERLETDYIDFYLLHALDDTSWNTVKRVNAINFLEKLRAEGKIRHIGFSFHHELKTFYEIIDSYDGWEFCQIQYNYLDENYQAGTEGLKYATSKDIGVIAMEPLRGGLLGRPPKAVLDIFARADNPRMPAEWALRWVWDHQEVVTALSGMGTIDEVLSNCAVATVGTPNSLLEKQRNTIESARDWFSKTMKVSCTGCRYCIPCPTKVFIPEIFSEYNRLSLHGALEEGRDSVLSVQYAKIKADGHGGDKCVDCGKCVSLCPQQISIPQVLFEVDSLLG